MVNIKDILLELLIGILFFASGFLIGISNYPYLIFLPFGFFVYLKIQIKKRKKILSYVRDDFRKIGYEILYERAAKSSEIKADLSFEPVIGATHLSRFKYIRRFYRIFKAKNENGKTVLLNSIVTKKWNGENHIEIVKIKNVS